MTEFRGLGAPAYGRLSVPGGEGIKPILGPGPASRETFGGCRCSMTEFRGLGIPA